MRRVFKPQAGGHVGICRALQGQELPGGHPLCLDAKLRHRACLEAHDGFGATAKSDLVMPMSAQQVGLPDFLEPARPRGGGRKHERSQLARVFGAPKRRRREAPNPGQHAQHLPRRKIERPVKAK